MRKPRNGGARVATIALGVQRGILWRNCYDTFQLSGVEAYGAVGMTALKDKVFSIDFDKGEVSFYKVARTDWGIGIPLRWKLGAVHVVAEIEGEGEEEFLIDTGDTCCHAGTIRKELFKKLVIMQRMPVVGSRAMVFTAGGNARIWRGVLGRLSLGSFSHRELIVGDNPTTSTLGLGYLSRYVVAFDMPRSTMYLRPGKEFDRVDRYDLSGISVGRRDKRTVVLHVIEESAGAEAGLERWDEIKSLDDVSAEKTSIFEIVRLLATPGERRIVVERYGMRHETTLRLSTAAKARGSKKAAAAHDVNNANSIIRFPSQRR